MRRSLFICSLIVLTAPAGAQARPGDLDETFSKDGLVKAGSSADHQAIAIQPDGAIVVAGGNGSGAIAVARYRPGGSVDTAFGAGGEAVDPVGPHSRATELAIDSEGRLVAAGFVGTGGTDGDFAVARFLPDGTVDSSFGEGGSVRIGFPDFEILGGLALTDADGIVLAGAGSGGTGSGAVLVAKLDEAGDPDSSFSGDGKQLISTTHPEQAYSGSVGGVALGDDGSIFIGWGAYSIGQGNNRVHVLKLDSAGDPVAGYGDAGTAHAPGEGSAPASVGSFVTSLDLDLDGRAVLSITACSSLHIYCVGGVRRFAVDGELDSSFGNGGTLSFDGPVAKVIAQPDGHLLLAGFERGRKPTRDDFAVRRLLASGTPDPAFSNDGLVTTDFDFRDDAAVDAGIGPDGRIVLVGSASFNRAGLARYEVADGPADADADGRLDDVDRCPQRYSKHRSGCPRIKRTVTIKPGEDDHLEGRVVSAIKPCANQQRVRLMRRRPGSDELVGRTLSRGESGDWRLRAPRDPATVYALVRRSFDPEIGRCGRARSKAIDVHARGTAR